MFREVTFCNSNCSHKYFLRTRFCAVELNEDWQMSLACIFPVWFKLESPLCKKEKKTEFFCRAHWSSLCRWFALLQVVCGAVWGCVLLSWWLVGAAWMSNPSQERLLAHSSLGSLWNPQMQSQFCAQESHCGPEWWCLSSRKPVWPLEDVCWGWREGRSSSDSTPGDQYPGFSLRADFHYWWKILSDLTVWRSLKKLRIKHDWKKKKNKTMIDSLYDMSIANLDFGLAFSPCSFQFWVVFFAPLACALNNHFNITFSKTRWQWTGALTTQ